MWAGYPQGKTDILHTDSNKKFIESPGIVVSFEDGETCNYKGFKIIDIIKTLYNININDLKNKKKDDEIIVSIIAFDGYKREFTLNELLNNNIMLVYEKNDENLNRRNGGPIVKIF